MNQADEFTSANALAIKSKGGGGYKQQERSQEVLDLIDANIGNRPEGIKTIKWNNWLAKFGSREGTEAAIKKADESAAYLKKHGNLKGNNNIWTDELTGKSYLVNNKT